MLDKKYQHQDIEKRIYKAWENAGAFRCGVRSGGENNIDTESFSIVIPPPNVTGTLHMGHALNNTIQDILVRFERMRGKDVLWQPGMDHAGIATQMVVERQLATQGEPDRRSMGREAFIERIWEWKAESGGRILNQLKRLGTSCDWERERFTMDEGLSKAVRKAFVDMHNDGLIYKDQRLVNWDTKFVTAISDLEVEPVETQGHMWHFKYPVKGDENRYIIVATTRPETMVGDTAVAVHPDDERYLELVGKTVLLPLTNREIPIIADTYADPEKGSGAVKITPAHDFNDFEVGKRHDLEMINILDEHGHLNENAPEAYQGMERFEARKKIVADIEVSGLLERIEDHELVVPYGDRSNTIIEPFLTDQWYVDAKKLAVPAIKAIQTGDSQFVPKNWEKTYFEWMNNIEPWCISRQLWWGHQIPAWYGPDGHVFVAMSEPEAQEQANSHYGKQVKLTQDEDVLDTWFSSGLWAFSTLGWPDDTTELKKYYPTSVLVTGFDIIFFWIARMMMMSLYFMKEVPFKTIYVHALVRDENGAKMSKSKGNVIDPLDIVDGIGPEDLIAKSTINMMNPQEADKVAKTIRKQYPDGIKAYGADALRFTLAAMAAQGRDVKLSIARIEGYRNFATKLWNASRFTQMNECVRVEGFSPEQANLTLSRWICGETQKACLETARNIEEHKFNEASHAIYSFTWHTFCDWYLELIKPILNGGDEAEISEIRAVTAWVLDQILIMLHPFMPFITEELWQKLSEYGSDRENMLVMTSWPELSGLQDQEAKEEIDWIIRLISEIRSTRSEMNVPAGARIPLVLCNASKQTTKRAEAHEETLKWLARLETIMIDDSAPKGSLQIILDEAVIALPMEGVIDVNAETERLKGRIAKARSEVQLFEKKLANKQFVSNAPAHVVEEQKVKKAEATELLSQLELALKRFENMAG